jgi:two-component system NtrC family response regulator
MPNDTILSKLSNLRDPVSLSVRRKVEEAAGYDTGILLFGETGTGKDFWAEYIHYLSGRDKMINLNCGDVPENLLESEWFGYMKGAFTGAGEEYEGRWKTAGDGTIFLNRIDLLNLNMQSRLLRIIERKKFYPLGSSVESDTKARFIYSADLDIGENASTGKFRKDLFYRISAYSIFVPPLRERKKDIMPLIRFFTGQKGINIELSPKGEKRLTDHRWEGNIRELENFVNNVSITKRTLEDNDTMTIGGSLNHPLQGFHDDITLREMEHRYIDHLIKKYKNKTKVAGILNISRKSLYDRIRKYGGD